MSSLLCYAITTSKREKRDLQRLVASIAHPIHISFKLAATTAALAVAAAAARQFFCSVPLVLCALLIAAAFTLYSTVCEHRTFNIPFHRISKREAQQIGIQHPNESDFQLLWQASLATATVSAAMEPIWEQNNHIAHQVKYER